jgi:uncharacterized C2H2 Zn-finger protein
MIIREMESYIVCPKCGYGFVYTTSYTREKIETIYKNLFKIHMDKCDHCKEAVLTIREAKFKIDKVRKQAYELKWQCFSCKAEWTQLNSCIVVEGASVGRALEKLKSETICPLCFVKGSGRVLSMEAI